jgi:hypothetical protein
MGVVVSQYALHNVSPEGRHGIMTWTKTASYLAEGIILIYVGIGSTQVEGEGVPSTGSVCICTLTRFRCVGGGGGGVGGGGEAGERWRGCMHHVVAV